METYPFSPKVPWDSIKVVLTLSVVFAVASTYGTVRKIIGHPIPEISRAIAFST